MDFLKISQPDFFQEQAFAGGGDPYNREVLTSSNANKTSDLYQYIKAVNNVRSSMKVWNFDQIQRYADDKFYAFSRGQTLVVLTNVGQYGETISRTITYHPYKDGQKLCNMFALFSNCFIFFLVSGLGIA